MLTAFTARPIVELKARDKSRIESLVAYGDRLLVGLHTGVLRIYRVNEPTAAAEPTHLLREVEKFAPRAIEQLAIIKEANTLVSLAGYAVSLHDLQSFAPLPGAAPLPGTKNASGFAVTSNIVKDPATGIPEIVSRLAVAVKRRLLLWTWYASELSSEQAADEADNSSSTNTTPPEILLPETIRSLTWASATKLVVGMNAGFVLVDVVTRAVEEIGGGHANTNGNTNGNGGVNGTADRFGALSTAGGYVGGYVGGYMGLGSYMPKPQAAKLADGEVLLAKDVQTLFIGDGGAPLDRRPIPWTAAPEHIGYSYPYILALQPPAKGLLEVRNPHTLSLLQTLRLPGAAQLHVPPPSVSLAHAGKGFHVASDRGIWKMDATAYDAQVAELVAADRLDEAISLLGLLEDALLVGGKAATLRAVKMQKADRLFRQKRYLAAIDLFNEEDVAAPPERVLRFFPRSLVGDLSGEAEGTPEGAPEGEAEAENGESRSRQGSHASQDSHASHASHASQGQNGETRPASPDPVSPVSPPPDTPSSVSKGFARRFLTNRRASSVTSMDKEAADEAASAAKDKEEAENTGGYVPLEGKELMKAAEALNSYLAGTRARLQRVIDPATGKLKRGKENLFGGDSDDDDDARERRLQATFTLVDTTMFRVLMLIRPKLASSLFRIPNFCDPAVVNERLLATSRYNELVDFFHGKRLHRPALELLQRFGDRTEVEGGDGAGDGDGAEVPSPLRGPARTIAYLQSLPPEMIDLILEFSAWTLRADPERGMDVFLADSENAETLPRDRVVRFLAGVDDRLEIRYLQHVISELNDLTPDFHNRLVEQMVRVLRGTKTETETETKTDVEKKDISIPRLVAFLRESRQYSLSKAFGLIPRDDPDFYEAQAVVLCNMGQHKQALEIYVFKMHDYEKAEEYCNRIHKTDTVDSDSPSPPSIYHTLLALYLAPPPPHAPQREPALALLSHHGSRLPAASTLTLIPDSLPVAQLAAYFRGRMRAATSAEHAGRIEKGLRQTAVLAAQARLLLGDDLLDAGRPAGRPAGRNRRVVVSEERLCGVCHKRLGGSVVAVMPDNAVVHYGCRNRK